VSPADASPILLVDDRQENLVALQAVLEPLGAPLVQAGSGEEALRHLLTHDVALILLDVQMPGLDGFAAARLIKQHPRTSSIPIIFLTAFDEQLDRAVEGYEWGAVDYLVKPFDPVVLRSKVQVFLELHRKTALLEQQAAELEANLRRLAASEAALAEAQRIARLGSWEFDVATGKVVGSEQLYRILGEHHRGPLDGRELYGRLEGIDPHLDRLRLAGGTGPASVDAVLVRSDGARRDVAIRVEPIRGPSGAVERVIGTVQDLTEQREAERALREATGELDRERELVERLQRTLAPGGLPHVPELDISRSYRPAEQGLVGGDWYDVQPLRDGRVLLVIGDVAGHGFAASSTMSHIRTALQVLALRESDPARLLEEINDFVEAGEGEVFVTMAVVCFDPIDGRCTIASAGHLPPVLCGNDGARVTDVPAGPPLGAKAGMRYVDHHFTLVPGGALLLFTDGLVERRGERLDTGLGRLCAAAREPFGTSDELADRVMDVLCADQAGDDVALLVVRRRAESPALHLELPAETARLASVRQAVRRWLAPVGADREDVAALELAVSELASNVCLHAYPRFSPGPLTVDAVRDGDEVRLVVRDAGRWRMAARTEGGRGLALVRAVAEEVHVEQSEEGTTVTVVAKVRRAAP